MRAVREKKRNAPRGGTPLPLILLMLALASISSVFCQSVYLQGFQQHSAGAQVYARAYNTPTSDYKITVLAQTSLSGPLMSGWTANFSIRAGSKTGSVVFSYSGSASNGWNGTVANLAPGIYYLVPVSVTQMNGILLNSNVVIGTPPSQFSVTVSGGTGSGNYTPLSTVYISAQPQLGQQFSHWTSSGLDTTPTLATTSFIMPARNVSLTANFRSILQMDFDNNDSIPRDVNIYSNLRGWMTITVDPNLPSSLQFDLYPLEHFDIFWGGEKKMSIDIPLEPGSLVPYSFIIQPLPGATPTPTPFASPTPQPQATPIAQITPDPDQPMPTPFPDAPTTDPTQDPQANPTPLPTPESDSPDDALKNLEKNDRETKDDQNQRQVDALNAWDGRLPDVNPSTIIDAMPQSLQDSFNQTYDVYSVPDGSEVRLQSGDNWIVDLSAGIGPTRYHTNLNPLKNNKIGPLLAPVANWIRKLIIMILILMGTAYMLKHYFYEANRLLAPQKELALGLRSEFSLAEFMAGLGGMLTAIASGTISGGAGTIAIGALLGGALARLAIPLAVHFGIFLIIMGPAFAALGAQGLANSFSSNAFVAQSLAGNIISQVNAAPPSLIEALSVLDAFLPLIFIISYSMSTLVTLALMRQIALVARQVLGRFKS